MSTTRSGLPGAFLLIGKVLLIAAVLALLTAYFGAHVREAGGTIAHAGFSR